jgi:hypothetical protein
MDIDACAALSLDARAAERGGGLQLSHMRLLALRACLAARPKKNRRGFEPIARARRQMNAAGAMRQPSSRANEPNAGSARQRNEGG